MTLARRVWDAVALDGVETIVEPTVGTGAFLQTAPSCLLARRWLCLELNAAYADRTRRVAEECGFENIRVECADAFGLDARHFADADLAQPLLAIGNPPWVTSAGQSTYKVRNLPSKANGRFELRGLDALTGKSNFDIAEAILLRLLDAVAEFLDVRIAFLVKRSVAMKLSRRLLGSAVELSFAAIDAKSDFGAAVDAGLFTARLRHGAGRVVGHIDIADELGGEPVRRAGFHGGRFVEDLDGHAASAHLEAAEPIPWRQGVKHDAAKVLELTPVAGGFENGLGEVVQIEHDVLCPLYKGSDLANGREARRFFPLYQADMGGPVDDLARRWPLLGAYLDRHARLFAARRSRIYAGKPPFSIFGVGPYTLAPWKVVVPGLYPNATFRVVGPSDSGRPSLVDDTCYLLPFLAEADARAVADHLNGPGPQRLLKALMDEGAKRPVTKALLSRVEIPLEPVEPLQEGDGDLQLGLVA